MDVHVFMDVHIFNVFMEGRKRVKDHMIRVDPTFPPVKFAFDDLGTSTETLVRTLEEAQHPAFVADPESSSAHAGESEDNTAESTRQANDGMDLPQAGKHLAIPENATGFSFERLFAPYLRGAAVITVHDPYIRLFWQLRNMMEFLEMVHALTPEGEQTEVKLITKSDMDRCVEQDEGLKKMEESFGGSRVCFSYEYNNTDSFHARSIVTDTGWKVTVDRGLDIFQRYDMGPFSLAARLQTERPCKAFEVTYLRTDVSDQGN